jgi:hypothetical protein
VAPIFRICQAAASAAHWHALGYEYVAGGWQVDGRGAAWVASQMPPDATRCNQVTDAEPFGCVAPCFLQPLLPLSSPFSAISGVSAHHSHDLRGLKMIRQDANAPFSAAKFPDVQKVLEGNAASKRTATLRLAVPRGRWPEATVHDDLLLRLSVSRNLKVQQTSL